MQHSANLDILRSFAVSVVVIDHLVPTLATHTGFHNQVVLALANHIGKAGVLAFFVHTSLVLMYSLERMTRAAGKVTLRFYLRRFFRIYPLSIFCITLALVLHIPDVTWQTPDIITTPMIFSNYLLMQNIFARTSILAPLWSLPFEVQMYLVLPALYFLTLRRRAVLWLSSLFVGSCGLGILVFWVTKGHLSMAEYIPCFLCGVLCYSLRDRIPQRVPAALWPFFVLLLICGYCLAMGLHRAGFYWIGWAFCLLLGLAINVFHNSTLKYINRAAEKLALYSYGVYLLHIPALYLVFIVLGIKASVLGSLFFIAITLGASTITYHFIESPFIDLGRRLSARPARSPILIPDVKA
jgi:peptidoglycan/LPS O-acetylase OafA/YrhL